ncbi:hypothetical protein R1flu_008597 [Riccia fluitans]|uniref:Uncharacterized protein n=1 Tax=Riccia fluitans TaxID=41844 RepID=A0ABD1YF97_9MARC
MGEFNHEWELLPPLETKAMRRKIEILEESESDSEEQIPTDEPKAEAEVGRTSGLSLSLPIIKRSPKEFLTNLDMIQEAIKFILASIVPTILEGINLLEKKVILEEYHVRKIPRL